MSDSTPTEPDSPGMKAGPDPDTKGVREGSPGGAVTGEIGLGEALSDPGAADLGGDGDLGGDEEPLRRKTAGGTDSG